MTMSADRSRRVVIVAKKRPDPRGLVAAYLLVFGLIAASAGIAFGDVDADTPQIVDGAVAASARLTATEDAPAPATASAEIQSLPLPRRPPKPLGFRTLPAEDLARFGISPDDLMNGRDLSGLLRFEGSRARAYYKESEPLVGMVAPRCRPALWALIEIYRRLLAKIEQEGYAVMDRRIALSPLAKVGIVGRAALRLY